MPSSPFDRYIAKHGKPYTVRIPNGKGVLYVEFHDGYVTLRSHQPGVHFDTTVNLTRRALWRMLRGVLPVAKKMKGDFDPNLALRRQMRLELQLLQERREQKRDQRQRSRQEAQQKRYKAAQRRARRN